MSSWKWYVTTLGGLEVAIHMRIKGAEAEIEKLTRVIIGKSGIGFARDPLTLALTSGSGKMRLDGVALYEATAEVSQTLNKLWSTEPRGPSILKPTASEAKTIIDSANAFRKR